MSKLVVNPCLSGQTDSFRRRLNSNLALAQLDLRDQQILQGFYQKLFTGAFVCNVSAPCFHGRLKMDKSFLRPQSQSVPFTEVHMSFAIEECVIVVLLSVLNQFVKI